MEPSGSLELAPFTLATSGEAPGSGLAEMTGTGAWLAGLTVMVVLLSAVAPSLSDTVSGTVWTPGVL